MRKSKVSRMGVPWGERRNGALAQCASVGQRRPFRQHYEPVAMRLTMAPAVT